MLAFLFIFSSHYSLKSLSAKASGSNPRAFGFILFAGNYLTGDPYWYKAWHFGALEDGCSTITLRFDFSLQGVVEISPHPPAFR